MELDTIQCGDSAELLKTLPSESVDFVLTSPPYDNLRSYNGYSFDFETIAKELYRVLKVGGSMVWVVGDATINGTETGTSFKQALYFKEIGFCLYDTMIYQKVNYVPLTHRRYEQAFEYMFVLTNGKPKTFNPIVIPCKNAGKLESYGLERRRSIDVKQAMRSPEGTTYKATKETKIHPNLFPYTLGKSRTGHPAPFPCELAHDMVYSWSNEGDVVLDPFMGSGTTALECVKLHRHFLGFEISEEYVKMANDRVKAIQPPDYLTYDT